MEHAPLRAFAAILLAGAAAASAEDVEYGRFQFGPFYLTPKVVLAPYGGVNTAGYGAPGALVSDNPTILTPSLDTVVPIGRRLRLKGAAASYFNLRAKEQDPFLAGYGGWGGAEVGVGPVLLFGSVGGGQSKERFSFELDQRVQRHDSTKAAGATLQLSGRITTTGSWTKRTSSYGVEALAAGESVSAALDRDSTTNRYAATLALTRLTALTLSADVIEDRFSDGNQRIRSYRYLGGLDFKPLAFIHGRVEAGSRRLSPGQGVPGYNGSTLSIAAAVPLFRLGTITGTVDRDITFYLAASSGARSTFLITRYRADLRFGLPLSLIAAPFYSTERDKDLGAPVGTTEARRLERYGSSLFRAFGRTFRIGGTVEASRSEGGAPRQVHYLATAEWTP